MRVLIIAVLLLMGCAETTPEQDRAVVNALSDWSNSVNAEESKRRGPRTEYQCMSDCMDRYSRKFCESKCAY